MPSKTFRIALIGAGGVSGAHVGACKTSEGRLVITAVADPKAESRNRVAEQAGAKPFNSADELFDAIKSGSAEADGVLVCTPPNARTAIIEQAMGMGLSVLAEKPLAHTLADARTLVQIASRSKAIGAVGYCHRFTPAVLEMKNMVRAGRIGRLTRFENTFATSFPALKDRWMSDPAISGGGSFIDTGCHSLDLFRFLVGQPWVEGIVKDHAWEGRGESSATAIVRASANGSEHPGVAGVILSGWLEPDRFTLRLVGTEGSVGYDYLKPKDLVLTSTDGKSEILGVETHEVRFLHQLLAFTGAVADGATNQLATFADGLVTAEALDAAGRIAR